MRGTTCCEQDASLAIIRRALRFERIVANADVATTTYSYDANGNLIQAGGWSYMWDYLNRMLASGYNNSTTTYAYDPSGARVLQTSTTSTTYYPNKYYSFTSTKSGSEHVRHFDKLHLERRYAAGDDRPKALQRHRDRLPYHALHPSRSPRQHQRRHRRQRHRGAAPGLLSVRCHAQSPRNTYPTNEKRQYIGQFSDAQTNSIISMHVITIAPAANSCHKTRCS